MKKSLFVLCAVIALAGPTMAEDPSPAPAAIGAQQPPQNVTIPLTDLQAFGNRLMELPYREAAPLLQELQRIITKGQSPIAPPTLDKPAKK